MFPKKPSERSQKASKRIPVDSLNSEKHSIYLQRSHRTRRRDSRATLGGAVLSKSWVTAERQLSDESDKLSYKNPVDLLES